MFKINFWNYKEIHKENKLFWYIKDMACECGCGMREFNDHIQDNYIDIYFISLVLFNYGITITKLEKI